MRNRRLPRTLLRGFTLVELMVVVMIIAISAALAIPSMMDVVRSRRVQKAGVQIFAVLQEARGRAFGRGSAVVASWRGTNGGLLSISEVQRDMDGDSDPEVPEPLCWAAAAPAAFGAAERKVSFWTQSSAAEGNLIITTTLNAETYPATAPTANGDLDLCFTPRGQLFQRAPVNPPNPWVRATSVYTWRIQRAISGVPEMAFVPGRGDRSGFVHVAPNGVARLAL
ncbi:MAG: prepilin-type N-terminal cleavage/methylation domain-containing protein [Myxococcales bacterium]|nr:prepilin-type N-terminal cleavage/methylation domain-containing protein [Myxococcales bacterium]